MKKKVITFGEIMLRLNPPGHQRIVQAQSYEASYAGGEANVAVFLSQLGLEVDYITKLPDNMIGKAAFNQLKRYGARTDFISWGGDRLGVYFIEHGASQRPSKIIYDRSRSAIAETKPDDFDWDEIFADAGWFHFTGITPALGENAALATKTALLKAKHYGVKVSCDLNYRGNLWAPEVACRTMTSLMEYVDVCLGNEEDIQNTFGITVEGVDVVSGQLDLTGYRELLELVMRKFDFSLIATSLRTSHSASYNGWSGIIFDGKELYKANNYNIHIVDRVGSGDSFAAGLIFKLINKADLQDAIDFAVAASCLKHTIPGDFNLVSYDEVIKLQKGDASGRVVR